MRGLIILAALGAAALVLASAPTAPVRFESKPRAVATGIFPQVAVRVTGDVSLLTVEGGDLWYLSSPDGGDSFPARVRVNEAPHEVMAHGENIPILVLRSMRELYAVWQGRNANHEGSVLRLARSIDWGTTFSKPVPVDPGSESQGFYTMSVSPKGIVYVAWLDGRERGGEGSGLYIARSANRGLSFEKSVRVASSVCPCCRPSLGFDDGDTVYISWRGVSHGDVRDIHVASSPDGGAAWSKPTAIAEDNWRLNACPHSGASLATLGKRLFVAWHTVREGTSQLYLVWSDDGGTTFSPRTNLRGTVLDSNHTALVAHGNKIGVVFQGRDPKENEGWGKQNAYYREIDAQGRLSDLVNAGHLEGSVNYPELLYEDPDHVFVVWHENADEHPRVAMIRGRLNGQMTATGGGGRAK
jgi:hypothetical protein